MSIKGKKRIMAVLVILFFISPFLALSQCYQQVAIDRSLSTQGISEGIDNYYRNLIVQNIALSSRQDFNAVSLSFDYGVHYKVDKCKPGQIQVKVYPVRVNTNPLFYLGYDIASSIMPEKADVSFTIVRDGGFVIDSLVFFNIPVSTDTTLYSSMVFGGEESVYKISASFSRAVFYYTKTSYEYFRDYLLNIDRYYAAGLLADSTNAWISHGHLGESGTKNELILKQFELNRIIDYINPARYENVEGEKQQGMHLFPAYRELQIQNMRFRAIIMYNQRNGHSGIVSDSKLLLTYLDWLDYYYKLAYRSDFRYVSFIEGLAAPNYTNAAVAGMFRLACEDYGVPGTKVKSILQVFLNGFLTRGAYFEAEGNQLRALSYYKTASSLAAMLKKRQYINYTFMQENRMKDSIAISYLAISRKSAKVENPLLAAQYYNKALKLYPGEITDRPQWLKDHELWMYRDFEDRSAVLLEQKKYEKAFLYLNEIKNHCQDNPSFPCPGAFNEWMRAARQGIYLDLLKKASALYSLDEFQEAGQKYRDAVAMRLGAGYRIEKDVAESDLERKFRQISFDEMLDDGLRFYHQGEFINSLYFLNKADYLQKSGLLKPYADLENYRQSAARGVIEENLSEGRVRAWAHDFQGAENMLRNIEKMLYDYGIDQNDTLNRQFLALKENVRHSECEIVEDKFTMLISDADKAEKSKDYILAHHIFSEAVTLSLDNIKCRIRDEEAWYRKIRLETPSRYQEMERMLIGKMTGDCKDFMDYSGELRKYYDQKKIKTFGIDFIPLKQRISAATDTAFLTCIFSQELRMRQYDEGLFVLERIRQLGSTSKSTIRQQKILGIYLARRDASAITPGKPWDLVHAYTQGDPWYKPLRKSYKKAWLKSTGWKITYWPLLWKK